jgi:hypothetical protein
MKIYISGLAILCLFLAAGAVPAGATQARTIMAQVDARDDGDRSIADMRMILIDKKGAQRTREVRSFGMDKGDDRYGLMFFLSPADVKGTGFLSYDYEAGEKDDDQWLYLPALKKTKRVAAKDKSGSFMGSDFTYADLTKRRLGDYTYSFYQEQQEAEVYGHQTWVIECLPVRQEVIDETGYTKSILFIRQDNFMVVRAIHFVRNGSFLKYLDVKEMAVVDGIWTGLEIHMTRKKGAETVHQTILTLSNVKYNQESVTEEMFTLRSLEKGL